jgi:hypothetical protein
VTAASSSPSLADWLQGWGTVAGSTFAALAAVAAVAVFLHDRAARRREEADSAAAQARAILVLVDAKWAEPELSEVTFILKNFSHEVIVDIKVCFRRHDERAAQGGITGYDYLGPGESAGWQVPLDPPVAITDDVLPDGMVPPDLLPTRIVFTDAAGRRWRRDARQQPVRLHIDEDPDLIAWAESRE